MNECDNNHGGVLMKYENLKLSSSFLINMLLLALFVIMVGLSFLANSP